MDCAEGHGWLMGESCKEIKEEGKEVKRGGEGDFSSTKAETGMIENAMLKLMLWSFHCLPHTSAPWQ